MWGQGGVLPLWGLGSKGIGFFSKIRGGMVGNLLSQFPLEGQAPSLGQKCSKEGGWKAGGFLDLWLRGEPGSAASRSPPSGWGRETCPMLVHRCLSPFPVIPVCWVCSL